MRLHAYAVTVSSIVSGLSINLQGEPYSCSIEAKVSHLILYPRGMSSGCLLRGYA